MNSSFNLIATSASTPPTSDFSQAEPPVTQHKDKEAPHNNITSTLLSKTSSSFQLSSFLKKSPSFFSTFTTSENTLTPPLKIKEKQKPPKHIIKLYTNFQDVYREACSLTNEARKIPVSFTHSEPKSTISEKTLGIISPLLSPRSTAPLSPRLTLSKYNPSKYDQLQTHLRKNERLQAVSNAINTHAFVINPKKSEELAAKHLKNDLNELTTAQLNQIYTILHRIKNSFQDEDTALKTGILFKVTTEILQERAESGVDIALSYSSFLAKEMKSKKMMNSTGLISTIEILKKRSFLYDINPFLFEKIMQELVDNLVGPSSQKEIKLSKESIIKALCNIFAQHADPMRQSVFNALSDVSLIRKNSDLHRALIWFESHNANAPEAATYEHDILRKKDLKTLASPRIAPRHKGSMIQTQNENFIARLQQEQMEKMIEDIQDLNLESEQLKSGASKRLSQIESEVTLSIDDTTLKNYLRNFSACADKFDGNPDKCFVSSDIISNYFGEQGYPVFTIEEIFKRSQCL